MSSWEKERRSFTISWRLLKLMSIELVMLPNQLLIPCHPPPPFAFNLSQHQGLKRTSQIILGGGGGDMVSPTTQENKASPL